VVSKDDVLPHLVFTAFVWSAAEMHGYSTESAFVQGVWNSTSRNLKQNRLGLFARCRVSLNNW
jgi:hypothetical protein